VTLPFLFIIDPYHHRGREVIPSPVVFSTAVGALGEEKDGEDPLFLFPLKQSQEVLLLLPSSIAPDTQPDTTYPSSYFSSIFFLFPEPLTHPWSQIGPL
jgi:hypothetical protein